MSKKNAVPFKYFHNPKCSKSRQGLVLLTDEKVNIEVVDYIKDSIHEQDARAIVTGFNGVKQELLRKKEATDAGVVISSEMTDDDIAQVLIKHPRILQRPILLTDKDARMGRPTEALLG